MLKYTESLQTGNVYNVDSLYFCQTLLKDTNFKGFDLIIANIPVYNSNQNIWESPFIYNQWLEERLSIYPKLLSSKGNLIVYTNEKYNFFIRNILRKTMIEKKTIIWVKKPTVTKINPNLKPSAVRTLINGYEHILWYAKSQSYIFNHQFSKANFNSYDNNQEDTEMLTDVWADIKQDVNDKYKKPEKLSDRVVRLFSYKGAVYIPFSGSGNEIISCIKNRKLWIATDTDKHVVNSINSKIVDRKNIIQKLI